jgi:hypothetical protein
VVFPEEFRNRPDLIFPSGIAGRLEGSIMVIGGGDVNVDFTWLWNSRETRTLISVAGQGGPTAQSGVSAGPVVHFNVHSIESLKGTSHFVGFPIGIGEVEVATGQNPDDSSTTVSIYVGLGPDTPGWGVPVYGGVGKTYEATELIASFYEGGAELTASFEEAIWYWTTEGYYGQYPRS